MHKETVKSTKDSSLSIIFTSLGLVILLIAIVGLSNLMYNRYGVGYTGYVAFILYILIGIYVYRMKIMKYQYSLIKNELIFENVVGNKNREIIRVNLDKVLYFCPLSYEKRDESTEYKNHYLTFKRKSPKAYVLAFKGDEKVQRIIFEPSQKLIDLIKKP